MKTVIISGTIGLDVTANDVRRQLDAAKKEDVEIQISSPGGLVFDGLEMANIIKNYPGETTMRIMGLCASMASYVALFGNKVIAEGNAVFMIHNPLGVAIGNQHDMTHTAEILAGLSDVLAATYSAKTGKSLAEIHGLMDSETFLFADEIKDAGFVDEMIGAPTIDKKTAIINAREKFTASMQDKRVSGRAENLTKIAACIGGIKSQMNTDPETAAILAAAGLPADYLAETNTEHEQSESEILAAAGLPDDYLKGL